LFYCTGVFTSVLSVYIHKLVFNYSRLWATESIPPDFHPYVLLCHIILRLLVYCGPELYIFIIKLMVFWYIYIYIKLFWNNYVCVFLYSQVDTGGAVCSVTQHDVSVTRNLFPRGGTLYVECRGQNFFWSKCLTKITISWFKHWNIPIIDHEGMCISVSRVFNHLISLNWIILSQFVRDSNLKMHQLFICWSPKNDHFWRLTQG
jgi:hypothetical protein